MSEPSKAITLKNLALRLCGEAPEGDITSDEVVRVRNDLIFYNSDDGALKAWHNDNPYPPLKSITERLFADWGDKYEGIPIREIDWNTFTKERAHLIKIEKADFEEFLKNNDAADRALEGVNKIKADFLCNWALAKNEPHGGVNLRQHYRELIKAYKKDHKTVSDEKKYLRDLYAKNRPWSDYEAASQTIERLNSENASLKAEMIQLQAEADQSKKNTPAYLDKSHRHYSPKLEAAIEAWRAIFQNSDKEIPSKAKRIDEWLDNSRPDVVAKDSITRVVNPPSEK